MYESGNSGTWKFLLSTIVPYHLATVYLNVPQATLIPNIYEFVGLTPLVCVFFRNSIFGIFDHTHK